MDAADGPDVPRDVPGIGQEDEDLLDGAAHKDGLAELDHLNKIMPG
jgi:hypothetical protein